VNLLGTHSAASRWFLWVAALPLVWTGIERLPGLVGSLRMRRDARLVLGGAGALLILSALDLPGVGARFENRSEDLRYAAALVAGEDRNRATALLRHALREDPANPAVHKDLGDALLKEDLADAARAEYMAALAIDPAYDPALLGLGEIFRVEADYAPADSIMTQLVVRHPQHPLYLNQLAAVKMLRGQYPEAEVLLNRALEIEPTYETALINLRALDETKRRGNALVFPEEVTREPSSELVSLGAQAIQALQQQNVAAADSLTALAMQRFPDDPLALFFRGAFFLRTNRIQEAVELLVRVVKAAPGRAMTTAAAAEALVKAGRSPEALELARESLAKAPDDANRTRIEQVIAFVESGAVPQ
jgi:tetratricopeptide (TPR) repeat protein